MVDKARELFKEVSDYLDKHGREAFFENVYLGSKIITTKNEIFANKLNAIAKETTVNSSEEEIQIAINKLEKIKYALNI